GEPHPRTGVPLADGTALYDSDRLGEALDGADVGVVAVASVGVIEVTRRALAADLTNARAVLLTSKGFAPDAEGRVRLLPEALRDLATSESVVLPPGVAGRGPGKAAEGAAGAVAGRRGRRAVQGERGRGGPLDRVDLRLRRPRGRRGRRRAHPDGRLPRR